MSKNQNKSMRAPVGQETTDNKMTHDEKLRVVTGRKGRLNADYYINLPEYADMTFFWRHDNDGSIDIALDIGASLVPRRADRVRKQYKGVNDQGQSEWAMVPAVSTEKGITINAYLMMMPKDEYHEYFIQPDRDRNTEIHKAMAHGRISQEDSEVGDGLKTYAGKIGPEGEEYNEIR